MLINNEKGEALPLHSLIGSLVKYYGKDNLFKSSFSYSALKMSISLFEKFNEIRNNKSYAHDNEVLDNDEAEYVVAIIIAMLNLLKKIDNLG